MNKKDNMYRVMRSVFRYGKLKEMNAPDILIENESNMMIKALNALNAEDIYDMLNSWEFFNKNQQVEDELQSRRLEDDLSKFFKELN